MSDGEVLIQGRFPRRRPQEERRQKEEGSEEVADSNVRYFDRNQAFIVEVLRGALDRAERGEMIAMFLTELDNKGDVSYSHGGRDITGQEAVKIVGSMEHQKSLLVKGFD